MNNADGKTIWQIKKYIDNIPTSAFVPTLENNATTNEQKAIMLQKTFFPSPPPANLDDIQRASYPSEIPFNHRVTIRQVRQAINQLSPDKAPGPDEITNRVLKHALPVIENHLQSLMQASINRGHFPKPFKATTTVVLRKPSKPDYTKAKAYRPIALENTLGKVMESIMATIISYLTETHELLPTQHYGGRPGRSAEDAMIILTENIYKAWKEKKVYTAVFMDVAGAFNNVHHDRLIHNLRKRRIPEAITRWTRSFLHKRKTQLLFNGTKSEFVPTPAGVPQGSPLSPLLYMYYNADLLDIAPQNQATSLGFIDDIMYGTQGATDEENAHKLEQILKKAEEWRQMHGAQFEVSKYTLAHFTRNHNRATGAPVTIGQTTINAVKEARYLGVIFDQKLLFKSHRQNAVKKGTKAVMALAGIAKNNWGPPHRYARQLFNAVIAPRIDYAASAWHRPDKSGKTKTTAQIRTLTTIQRIAMKAITGCYRTTPTAALEIEAGLQPAWIRLQEKVLRAVTRLQSLSVKHPIHEWLGNARINRTAAITHRSNLENIMQQFPETATKIEAIEPYIRPPWWEPKIHIQVEATKNDAKAKHDELQKRTPCPTIYTDGSGIQGKVGAATYNSGTSLAMRQHLGSDRHYNVFAAEVYALSMAAKAITECSDQKTRTYRIFTDSQAAIKAINNPQRQSGQSIIKECLDYIDKATTKYPKLQVEVVWIPGHEEIDGNERADKEAKEAALTPPMRYRDKLKHWPLKSSQNQIIRSNAKTLWKNEWNDGTGTAINLRRITRRRKVTSGPKLYDGITNRNTAAMLAQLRTNHCGLNKYLHRFGHRHSPYCDCGYGKETVEHFLMECRTYRVQRRNMQKKIRSELGRGNLRMDTLLGDPKIVKYTMEYVQETGRLKA